jgi:hypothetical protein
MTCGFLIGRPSLLESKFYSRIAVAEVSEFRRNSDALRRKISDRERNVDFSRLHRQTFHARQSCLTLIESQENRRI